MSNFVIYTSYHAKNASLKRAGIVPISISRFRPRYQKGHLIEYFDLAPNSYMLKMTQEEYDIEFAKILASRDPQKVYLDLKNLSEGQPVALLCYEKDRCECHRHKVALWLEEELNIEVKEYEFQGKTKKDKPGNDQLSIF